MGRAPVAPPLNDVTNCSLVIEIKVILNRHYVSNLCHAAQQTPPPRFRSQKTGGFLKAALNV